MTRRSRAENRGAAAPGSSEAAPPALDASSVEREPEPEPERPAPPEPEPELPTLLEPDPPVDPELEPDPPSARELELEQPAPRDPPSAPVADLTPANPAAPSPRPIELALARLHLRLGSLTLARVELEILNDHGALDLPGQVDLAEVRWRTGTLAAAGEAATAALAAGEDEPVALVIAAEAAAALGRPTEARRLAAMAMERLDGPLDRLFAGMPRSSVWPPDATEPPPIEDTLFHREPDVGRNLRAGDTDATAAADRATVGESGAGPAHATPTTVGFWDSDDSDTARTQLPDPADELQAARAAVVAGSLDEASLRFALALRLAPALAPSVLEATAGVSGPAIDLLRGDAYRLLGLEPEAERSYAAAAWSGDRDWRREPKPPARQSTTRRTTRRARSIDPHPPAVDDTGPAAAPGPGA